MPATVIYHIDVNSAYLSWEAADRLAHDPASPDIRTFPAAIGGSEELRHGIVLAKSPAAKAYGVTTGEPLAQARRKCPVLQVFPPHFDLYVRRSEEFMTLLRKYAPEVEAYSIDEAFCDMTGTASLYGDLTAFAHTLKDTIHRELGFTVNIGVSENRLLAKMASDFEKPDRVHTLFPDEIASKLWPLPVGELFSVGKSAAKKLHSVGIMTIGDLAHTDRGMLISLLKSHGDTIWNYANGIESSALTHADPACKSYGSSLTISSDVTDADTAHHVLLSLCETVGARIRAAGVYISVVQMQIVDHEFRHMSRQMTLPSSTNVTERIYECACQLFDAAWDCTPVRLLGVSTSRVSEDSYEQLSLFDVERSQKLAKLNSAVDAIRTRYGDDAIQRACFVRPKEDDGTKLTHMTGGMSGAKRRRKHDS